MILVSSCLLGLKTRYDGGNNAQKLLLKYKDLLKFIPVCPEVEGGLSIPRLPAEIVNGDGSKVLTGQAGSLIAGRDVTTAFVREQK